MFRAFAEEHSLDDFVDIDAVHQRLADALVAEEGDVRVVGAPAEIHVAVVRPLVELEGVDLREIGNVAGLEEPGSELAGLELRRQNGGVRYDLLHPLLEVGRALPVILVAGEDDLVALAPFLEFERSARDGRRVVLGRLVDDLGRVIVHGVLAEDVLRHRRRTEDVGERRAEHLGELHRELLGVRRIDLDARDARRLPRAVVLVSLDVVEDALVRRDLAPPLHLHAREEVVADDRLAVGPVGFRVDGPGVGKTIRAEGPGA